MENGLILYEFRCHLKNHINSTYLYTDFRIFEERSWIFLYSGRIFKPGSSTEKAGFYGPKDFAIGSTIDVFGTRFLITEADEYVVKFMEAHRDQFPEDLIGNLSVSVVSDIITKKNVDSRFCKKGGAANLQRT